MPSRLKISQSRLKIPKIPFNFAKDFNFVKVATLFTMHNVILAFAEGNIVLPFEI